MYYILLEFILCIYVCKYIYICAYSRKTNKKQAEIAKVQYDLISNTYEMCISFGSCKHPSSWQAAVDKWGNATTTLIPLKVGRVRLSFEFFWGKRLSMDWFQGTFAGKPTYSMEKIHGFRWRFSPPIHGDWETRKRLKQENEGRPCHFAISSQIFLVKFPGSFCHIAQWNYGE